MKGTAMYNNVILVEGPGGQAMPPDALRVYVVGCAVALLLRVDVVEHDAQHFCAYVEDTIASVSNKFFPRFGAHHHHYPIHHGGEDHRIAYRQDGGGVDQHVVIDRSHRSKDLTHLS